MPSIPLFASHDAIVRLFVQIVHQGYSSKYTHTSDDEKVATEHSLMAWTIMVSTLSGENLSLYREKLEENRECTLRTSPILRLLVGTVPTSDAVTLRSLSVPVCQTGAHGFQLLLVHL